MAFLHQQLFTTPYWMLDKNILSKTKATGSIERIRSMQVRTLNSLLAFDRLARVIENGTLNGNNAYGLTTMMEDLRKVYGKKLRKEKRQIPIEETYSVPTLNVWVIY